MSTDFFLHLWAHVALAASALAIAAVVAIPAASAFARRKAPRSIALGVANIVRVIPSLAILTLTLPFLGLGFRPALLALAVLAIPPILINADLGLRSVPLAAVEAARGLGMAPRQIRRRVEWPLAAPVVFAGIRTAAVEVLASATLAAFIGGGGLGEYVIDGLANYDIPELLEGAIAVAALAFAADWSLGAVERAIAGKGMRPA